MKNSKKLVALLLSLSMVFALAACGGGSTASPSPSASQPAPTESAPAETTPAADEGNNDIFKLSLVNS